MPKEKPGSLTRCVRRMYGRNCGTLKVAERIVVSQNAKLAAKKLAERWTIDYALGIALFNGLDEMERRYCPPKKQNTLNTITNKD